MLKKSYKNVSRGKFENWRQNFIMQLEMPWKQSEKRCNSLKKKHKKARQSLWKSNFIIACASFKMSAYMFSFDQYYQNSDILTTLNIIYTISV